MLKPTVQAAKFLAKWLKGPATNTELGIRVGMDVIPATMNAIATPGDLFDKAVAGATDLALSSTLGLAAGRLGSAVPALAVVALLPSFQRSRTGGRQSDFACLPCE